MRTILVEELKNKLDEFFLIDVREPAEHLSECIEPSVSIPLGKIDLTNLPKTHLPIVVYCRSGKRSEQACLKLLQQNSTLNLYSLEGGVVAWQQAGYKVSNLGKKILPLERQTQLTIGFLIFSSTLLGTFLCSKFYIVPAFIGLGLMFAGLTGWCGMAKIIAKMPWNK